MKLKPQQIASHTSKVKSSEVMVEEKGRKATFLNKQRSTFLVTKVDGGVIVHATACDYIVSKNTAADLLIELKGTDVKHGIEQIRTTAEIWDSSGARNGKLAGLIVCSRLPNPRFSTTIQRDKNAFVEKYKSPLHIVDKNHKYEFERVLSFSGPL